jgi:arginine decarboxylase-like protein
LSPSKFLLYNFHLVVNEALPPDAESFQRIQESVCDASQFRCEADRLFKLGIMNLNERAEVEDLFAAMRDLAKRRLQAESVDEIAPVQVSF